MSKIDFWILTAILRRTIVQGPDHSKKITGLYAMIREACREKFREDNEITIDDYLNEWFQDSQYKDKYHLLED